MSSDCLAGKINDVMSLDGLDCVKLGPKVTCCVLKLMRKRKPVLRVVVVKGDEML